MLELDFGRQGVAGAAQAVGVAVDRARFRLGIAALDDEIGNHPVKNGVVIETVLDQLAEVFAGPGRGEIVQFDDDAAEGSFYDRDLVFIGGRYGGGGFRRRRRGYCLWLWRSGGRRRGLDWRGRGDWGRVRDFPRGSSAAGWSSRGWKRDPAWPGEGSSPPNRAGLRREAGQLRVAMGRGGGRRGGLVVVAAAEQDGGAKKGPACVSGHRWPGPSGAVTVRFDSPASTRVPSLRQRALDVAEGDAPFQPGAKTRRC